MESIQKMSGAKITSKLMYAGISPKYKAFAYLLYLVQEFDPEKSICMSNKDLMDAISKNFNVSSKRITANFKSLMENCEYRKGKKSEIYEMLACLDKNELPTVKEFLTAVQCIILQDDD